MAEFVRIDDLCCFFQFLNAVVRHLLDDRFLGDEIDASSCITIEELRRVIEDYIEFYNSGRYQWSKKNNPGNNFEVIC
ncbi:IS3 family transposase [Fictibacillus terranigra]|uniref:IS3 family transposase n=1 Tax=Fictibacillus terranigra TaxID=3058424 RepID=A0ABT8EC53_9BACL|nr:IS3 family transposase [Fictibacillus sp. CENA-BCM004]MDN4075412.1 IS3 family transposase [Fictibacillus sp. CENA-BCM004]